MFYDTIADYQMRFPGRLRRSVERGCITSSSARSRHEYFFNVGQSEARESSRRDRSSAAIRRRNLKGIDTGTCVYVITQIQRAICNVAIAPSGSICIITTCGFTISDIEYINIFSERKMPGLLIF